MFDCIEYYETLTEPPMLYTTVKVILSTFPRCDSQPKTKPSVCLKTGQSDVNNLGILTNQSAGIGHMLATGNPFVR